MLLSGGTTGLPKVIPRTHNDYVYNCRQCGTVAGYDAATVFLALLPMAHNYTLGCPGVLGALAHGGTAVIAADTGIKSVARLIEAERVTVVSAAVPLIVNWLNADLAGHNDLSSLQVMMNGGAKLLAPGIAPPGRTAIWLRVSGELRHRRGAAEHDAPRRPAGNSFHQFRAARYRRRTKSALSMSRATTLPKAQ